MDIQTTHKREEMPVYSLPVTAEREASAEGESVAQTLQAEQTDVKEVVSLLSAGGVSVRWSAVHTLGMLSMPLLAIGLFAFCMNGPLTGAAACLLGLIASLIVTYQADLLDRERVALQNARRNKRWMAALSETLDWPERRVAYISRLLLTQFLLRLRDSDAYLFSRKRLNCLYRCLTPRRARWNPELAVAILRALPHIGTDSALPYVARLAARPAFTSAGICNEARAVLPLLEQRVADQRAAEQARREAAAAASSNTERTESENAELAAINARLDVQIQELETERRKVQAPGMRVGFLLASWGIIVPYTALQAWEQFAEGRWPAGALFALLSLLCTQLYRFTFNDRHKRLANKLGEMDDARCIGRLAELLDWPDEEVRAIAIAALRRLLPRAKASDRALRTPGQRASLYRMLALANAREHAEFQITLLKALEQIGDASAVPFVENLANAQPSSARDRAVCDAAADCLPYLLTRSEMNRSSQTLLRASSATATGADMLMRPAAHDVTNSEELLRASSGSSRDGHRPGNDANRETG